MEHVPHLPKHWAAGILKEDEWVGEFYATPQELLVWCEEEFQDELVVQLVLDLCDSQKVYEEWWEGVRKRDNDG
jgi:hypothetical protein